MLNDNKCLSSVVEDDARWFPDWKNRRKNPMREATVHWYVAALKPNATNIAKRNLKRQGFETFLPLQLETQRRGSKFVEVSRPLFPGYVFVRLGGHATDMRKVNSTLGVSRLVSFGGVPATVPRGLIDELKKCCDGDGFFRSCDKLLPGDQVVLTSGPFAQFVATVEKLTPDRRAWVLLELLGGKTRILVEPERFLRSV